MTALSSQPMSTDIPLRAYQISCRVSGEVARRERWLAKKTEEVRERTVKGLEPEVQRIVEQHKADLLELEAQHQVCSDTCSSDRTCKVLHIV